MPIHSVPGHVQFNMPMGQPKGKFRPKTMKVTPQKPMPEAKKAEKNPPFIGKPNRKVVNPKDSMGYSVVPKSDNSPAIRNTSLVKPGASTGSAVDRYFDESRAITSGPGVIPRNRAFDARGAYSNPNRSDSTAGSRPGGSKPNVVNPYASDHWGALGLKSGASQSDISKAFRRLSKQFHPDMPGGSHEKFLKISQAYNALRQQNNRGQ